ncbi:MAG TPA: hypothetical protein DCQ97_09750 [Chitinophagaceae bacterium]|nr:hypothetical protein [Chitinophagaceae bacterium]
MYEVIGGAVEGDHFKNLLFENSSVTGNNWIRLKLVGNTANRSAIGARVKIKTKMADGSIQLFYHTVSTGGSFGSSPLRIEAGLGKAVSIEEIEIKWPNEKHSVEIISNPSMNTSLVIKEKK